MRRGDVREPVAQVAWQHKERRRRRSRWREMPAAGNLMWPSVAMSPGFCLGRHAAAERGNRATPTRLLTPRCRAGDADPDGQAPGLCQRPRPRPRQPDAAVGGRAGPPWLARQLRHPRAFLPGRCGRRRDAGPDAGRHAGAAAVHRLRPGPLRRPAPGVRRRRPRRRPAAGGAFPAGPAAGGLLRLGQPDGAGPGRSTGPARRGPGAQPRQQRAVLAVRRLRLVAHVAGPAGAATGPAGDAGLRRRAGAGAADAPDDGAARVAEHRVRPPRVPARRGHLR